jgi:D-alanyl-lipoteichoic acid acyltransferase DltB (MBOAT superfamily)
LNFTDPLFFVLFPFFLVLTLALRWLEWWRLEKLVLVAAGCALLFTYGSADLLVFVAVGGANYLLAGALSRLDGRDRTTLLALILALDLGALAYFKYFSFLLGGLFPSWHVQAGTGIVIPLGISFYTFHVISYQVDLYRRRIAHARPLDFAVYLSLFPHLIAGPIVRGAQLIPQIVRVNERRALVARGLMYFIVGLFLKRFCADHIGPAIDPFWREGSAAALTTTVAWAVVFLYYCQIYADFAGYSAMAIGMAALLGYDFPQNFLGPMTASSLREFWRRWHVTLSSWLRDYLYIPLGGSRRGLLRTAASVLVTMILGGLWHGAGWTFVAWGALHGVVLAAERVLGIPVPGRRWWSVAAGLLVAQLVVLVAWVFFRAPGFDVATTFLRALAGLSGNAGTFPRELSLALPLALPVIGHNLLGRVGEDRLLEFPIVAGALCGVLLALIIAYPASSVSFIYYTF